MVAGGVQRCLQIDHSAPHFARVAALIDDELTADVTFVVTSEASSAPDVSTVLQRDDTDTGQGEPVRTPAVVLDADFGADASQHGSQNSSAPPVVTAGRASRRTAAVSGDYSRAIRADGSLDRALAPATTEFRVHRAIFAAASNFFRDILFKQSAMAGGARLSSRVSLPPAITPAAFRQLRHYIYSGAGATRLSAVHRETSSCPSPLYRSMRCGS